jgi:hypothetical protein
MGFEHPFLPVGLAVLGVFVDFFYLSEADSNKFLITGIELEFTQLFLFLLAAMTCILTAGVGGSMLSIGPTAGVAVLGQARGIHTICSHFKWALAIVLGYTGSIKTNIWLNASVFTI